MIIWSWNCQGLNKPAAVRALRLLLNSHKPHVLLLSEIKISVVVNFLLASSLHFQHHYFVPARGKAGGLAMLEE